MLTLTSLKRSRYTYLLDFSKCIDMNACDGTALKVPLLYI